jgi:uncharacterized membrane protein
LHTSNRALLIAGASVIVLVCAATAHDEVIAMEEGRHAQKMELTNQQLRAANRRLLDVLLSSAARAKMSKQQQRAQNEWCVPKRSVGIAL